MKRTRLVSTIAAFALTLGAIFILSANSNAQGRYANRYSNTEVSNIIRSLEQSSNTFSTEFNRQMDRSRINGTVAETDFGKCRDYENSLDRLRQNFDRNNTWWNARSDVQNVLGRGQPVNTMMNSISFRRNLERQWNAMRNDLNKLADTFDLPGLNGGGFIGGPTGPIDGGNGQRGQVPNWAVGTFYGTNPQDGSIITLYVNQNGNVTVNFGTGISYATIYRQQMNHNGIRSRIERINNGIATVRTITANASSIIAITTVIMAAAAAWDRSMAAAAAQMGQVPTWAVGSFWATNPQSGGRIDLTIASNGSVTISFDGGNFLTPAYTATNLTMVVSFRGLSGQETALQP